MKNKVNLSCFTYNFNSTTIKGQGVNFPQHFFLEYHLESLALKSYSEHVLKCVSYNNFLMEKCLITFRCLSLVRTKHQLQRKWGGQGRVAVRCTQHSHPPPPPPIPISHLSALLSLHFRKSFLIRLLYCFWNNFTWFSSINVYSNGINIKPFEFCLEALYRECHEIAKNLRL